MSNSDDFENKKVVAANIQIILSGKVVDLMMELNRDDAVKLLISWVEVHAYAAKIAAIRDTKEKEEAFVLLDAARRLQKANDEIEKLGMDLSNDTMNKITEESGGEAGMWSKNE